MEVVYAAISTLGLVGLHLMSIVHHDLPLPPGQWRDLDETYRRVHGGHVGSSRR